MITHATTLAEKINHSLGRSLVKAPPATGLEK